MSKILSGDYFTGLDLYDNTKFYSCFNDRRLGLTAVANQDMPLNSKDQQMI